ncbi:MAG: beta-galactosidase [Tepidisphaeraceae bacterium]
MTPRYLITLLAVIGGLLVSCTPSSQSASPPSQTNLPPSAGASARIRYDNQCFIIDGKDTFLYSGSFHYFRCPKPLWADRFQKMKDAGLNCVETYVAWNWHEQQPPAGLDDFSKMDMTDLTDWLDMAINRFGFYVILRPGPYICAEWDGGGYPQWLVTKRPAGISGHWLRGDDPVYLDWCKHWYTAAAKATVPFQITHMPAGKPGVILWQIENEYDYGEFPPAVKLRQLQALAHDSRDLGIDVPLITCVTENARFRQDPYLQQNVIECRNTYPRFDAANELHALNSLGAYQPGKPKMITELQGGWFSDVGGHLSQDLGLTPQQITHVTLVAWALGYTGTNYYMMFGGTNVGDWGSAERTTTYDYAAPIREWGGVGGRYFAVQAMANFLKEHAAQLVRSESVEVSIDPTLADITVYLRRGKNGERFLFFLNNSQRDRLKGTLRVTSNDAGIDGEVAYALDPFDGKILCLPAGESDPSKGQWYPRPVAPPQRPTNLPAAIALTSARRQIDPGPAADSWRDLARDGSVEDVGIFDRRYVYYRTNLPPITGAGMVLSARLPAQDSFLAQLNDRPLEMNRYGAAMGVAPLPDVSENANSLLVLYENGGRANGGPDIDNRCGLIDAAVRSAALLPIIVKECSLKIENGDPTNDVTADLDSSWRKTSVNGRANQIRPRQAGVFRLQIVLTAEQVNAGGKILTFGSITGDHSVLVNGRKLTAIDSARYDVSDLVHEGPNSVAVIVTAGTRNAGIGGAVELDPATPVPSSLAWQVSGETAGSAGKWWDDALDDSNWETVNLPDHGSPASGATKLCWYRLRFELPRIDAHVWAPWKLHLQATGNGFIYLNGHALGRYWEVGPQWDFYLPECWLNFGPGSTNVVTLCMKPTKNAPSIQNASVSPYGDFAESR